LELNIRKEQFFYSSLRDRNFVMFLFSVTSFYLCCSCLVSWWWLDLRTETSRQKNVYKYLLACDKLL